jgi:hypothetical protein
MNAKRTEDMTATEALDAIFGEGTSAQADANEARATERYRRERDAMFTAMTPTGRVLQRVEDLINDQLCRELHMDGGKAGVIAAEIRLALHEQLTQVSR